MSAEVMIAFETKTMGNFQFGTSNRDENCPKPQSGGQEGKWTNDGGHNHENEWIPIVSDSQKHNTLGVEGGKRRPVLHGVDDEAKWTKDGAHNHPAS